MSGQFWRIVTSCFVHLNVVHLAFNMLFLWRFGTYLDRSLSRLQVFAVYLLTGAASSVASLAWYPIGISAGASGAIYGEAGVLIAFLVLRRLNLSRQKIIHLLIWFVFIIPFGVIFGHFSKTTDYAAHVGGIASGLVIGFLLAPTFHISQTDRATRQRHILEFVTITVVVMLVTVTQLRSNIVKFHNDGDLPASQFTYERQKMKVTRVFINLKGDPKLVHRLATFLGLELEDAGIIITRTEPEAEAVISGELSTQDNRVNFGLGLVRMEATANDHADKINSCATLSTAEDGELFDSSAGTAAGLVREKYPNARTVRLDPASDMAVSSKFGAELPHELKTSGFSVSDSMPADIALRINLERQKVAIDEHLAEYEIRVVTRNRAVLSSYKGEDILFAKAADAAPAACADRFTDFKWLYSNDPLLSAARKITAGLRE